MFFEGLPNRHLGGTVLLRGGSKMELNAVKNIFYLMLFTCYNWRVEHSFLMDEFALPPSLKCEFLEDSKDNSPEFPGPKSENSNDSKFEVIKKNDVLITKRERIEHIKIAGESIEDCTDPLQSIHITPNSNNENEKLTVTELPFTNTFRKCLDDTILCISPYIVFSPPYLETESGKRSNLRKFFPKEIYSSEQFNSSKKARKKDFEDKNNVIIEPKMVSFY